MPDGPKKKDRHKPHRTIRIPQALYDELEAIAQANERPVHWEARKALRRHIDREKQQHEPPPPEK